jgi:hypothetical protein
VRWPGCRSSAAFDAPGRQDQRRALRSSTARADWGRRAHGRKARRSRARLQGRDRRGSAQLPRAGCGGAPARVGQRATALARAANERRYPYRARAQAARRRGAAAPPGLGRRRR